ncbi:MAG: aspartate kinase [Syntrophomonadaceae bacterium]|nr:aspartate kinase [Syntrophomonadaceae bacterium]
MRILVQKFGGTSLATTELRSRVCDIVESNREAGYSLVVVVSAMGRDSAAYATDTLINLVKEVNPDPLRRELDILLSCGETIAGVLLANQLTALGIPATFLSGEQAGIRTDGNYGNAHIRYVSPAKLIESLDKGLVVVVAGFQGVGENGDLTTLGRGGSDTTACALGIALNAEFIDIYTDVEGVMTADPRIVDNARLLDSINYNEICQLARDGAKVVHPRAIEIAMQKGIPVRIRSTFSDSVGTTVSNQIYSLDEPVKIVSDRLITGITYTSNIAQIKISLNGLENKNSIELMVFKSMAEAGISVDFITVQQEAITFTVNSEKAMHTKMVLNSLNLTPDIECNCAKVAVVGAAMTGIPGVMYKVVEALADNDISILQSGDSYTNIWCLVKQEDMKKAVRALHDKFELGNGEMEKRRSNIQ